MALESAGMAHAQGRRASAALDDLTVLERFRPASVSEARPQIAMGTIIEVEAGDEGRTIFLAPVGAGIELTMPARRCCSVVSVLALCFTAGNSRKAL